MADDKKDQQGSERRRRVDPTKPVVEFGGSSVLKAIQNQQRWMAGILDSPAMKAIQDQQRRAAGISELPAVKAMQEQQRRMAGIVDSPAVKAIQEQQRRMVGWLDSPTMKAMQDQQRRITSIMDSPAVKAMQEQQRRMAGIMGSPAIRAMQDQQRQIAGIMDSPAMKAIQDQQRHIAGIVDSPAVKAMMDQQRRMVGWLDSPAMKAMQDQQRRITSIMDSSVLGAFRGGLVHVYERAMGWLDRHWADLETENADHPHPVLFLVASFSMAVGLPIYESAKIRDDDTALLATLEPVLTDAEFVNSVKTAIRSAPFVSDIAKEHLETGFDWLVRKELVKAYPPFYNGLESALYSVARAEGIIDTSNRFINAKGKAKKVEDLFGELIEDPRYRRYLRSWVFGDHGNPFRHGDVSDADACDRQSLRLAAAVIGWLEIFGGWMEADFARRLEASARRYLAITQGNEGAQAA
jgi:hypothetical protein